jgi:hypothetical protein
MTSYYTSHFNIENVRFRSIDNSLDEQEDKILASHIATITQFPTVFSNIKFSTKFGTVDMNFDWIEFCSLYTKIAEMSEIEWEQKREYCTNTLDQFKALKIKCTVIIRENNAEDEVQHQLASYLLEIVLSKIFLASNISSPGALDLDRCYFFVNRDDQTTMRLSQFSLEVGYETSLRMGWPSIERLDLALTWDWIMSVTPEFHQVAHNEMERALFALLHVCSSSMPDPSSVIWTSHALENLYQTPTQGIVETLKRRIFMVLGTPVTHIKSAKKDIDKFYGLRSSFVHGRFDICHPASNDRLDEEFGSYIDEVTETHEIGVTLVIATLQKLVKNRWVRLTFNESVDGLKIWNS